ncbi:putative LRR receptor-like serine/threonine-protein kinase [Dorcoceras hygrometricum]|uniref:Putative LRR receptor-like serine/threonine-protein kinase n=1 Tax=Dorcoceras hygrometricum TaxID=472368 RepID=A0A2Z7CN23_9LAMI|nr:putative LRR receptor-like serine/threonine-protein kinase [Dorcoceras hygrometricum]
MAFLSLSIIFFSILLPFLPPTISQPENSNTYATSVPLLMAIKASLDPQNLVLSSWSLNSTSGPCNGSFEGIACNEFGQVVNISLQGKGLSGQIPPEIGQLKNLTGLYLHFNEIHGVVPKELADLTDLSDLYLNVNNLSGHIPSEIGSMCNLQVLQLCYNILSGSIPTQLGSLKKLSVLALQSNKLSGAIPASLGNLFVLTRLDLSINNLFGSIPSKLADLPLLKVLDIRNNTFSGNVPLELSNDIVCFLVCRNKELKRLNEGFQYANNPGLCGNDFSSLNTCSDSSKSSSKPEPFGPGTGHIPSKDIPESANVLPNGLNQSKRTHTAAAAVIIVIGLIVASTAVALFTFSWYRRRKQKIGSTFDSGEARRSTDQVKDVGRRTASPLISLEYSSSWDPLAKREDGNSFSQEVLESYMFTLDAVESATQYFSETNLLGKSSFSAIYKGILRDGSAVAIKCISKISCKSDETEFLKGLKLLTSLKHENLLRLRGFCCSKGRGECFLIYDFVSNGNLLQYLDVKDDKGDVLDWPTRKSIIQGIAQGIRYLHGTENNKRTLVHRNISAEKILIDKHYNPLLSDSGLQNLLADDIVFSTLKGSAAMGYLAPEYTTTGRFTEKSDIYAFGMIIFQILSGKSRISQLNCHGAELSRFEDFIDANLAGNFKESEAARLGEVALLCTNVSPDQRPDIEGVMQELDGIGLNSCSNMSLQNS